MVRWIIQQLDDFAGMDGKVYDALKELRTHATAFRAIVDPDLDMRDNRPFVGWNAIPPAYQAVYYEVVSLEGASECQM